MQLHERSFGGFRPSPKPPTCWDEGSSSRCSRRQREAQSCQPISPAVQQYSLTPTASRKSTKAIKSTRLTIRRRTRRIQSKKSQSPVEKGRLRLAESDCIRNGLRFGVIKQALFSPLPTTVRAFIISREVQPFLPLSTCIELRLPALLGALSSRFFFAQQTQKFDPRYNSTLHLPGMDYSGEASF